METRTRRFLLAIGLLASGLGMVAPASAAETIGETLRGEPVIQPEVKRTEVETVAIDEEDFEIGLYGGILGIEDFGSAPVYGAKVAYHITEDFFLEAALGTSTAGQTSYETLSGNVQLLTDSERQFTYYNLSVGWNILPGEVFISDKYAFNSQFYIIAGIGSTHFAGDDNFTINGGVGYRLLLTDEIAVHLDARDHVFSTDLLGTDKATHNLELTAGLSFFF